MTPEELHRSLTVGGYTCRARGDEVVLETCWFCDNTRWNLELNVTRGVYHCWACNSGGRLDRILTTHLGYEVHLPVQYRDTQTPTAQPLDQPPFTTTPAYELHSAARYLARRFIDQGTAKRYGLGVCTGPDHHSLLGRLVIPIRDFWTGTVVGYVGRSYTHQHPKYMSTITTRTVAGYRVRSWNTACVFVEGFFDGIAVHLAGYHAAVLAGTSAPNLKEFVARLPPTTPVVIMLDGEAAEEANRLRWAIQGVRGSGGVHTIALPTGYDPSQFLPHALERLVTHALA